MGGALPKGYTVRIVLVTEPNYEYVPGKGWVPVIESKVLASQKDGRKIWIIDRQPNIGEMWVAKEESLAWSSITTFEKAIDHVRRFNYDDSRATGNTWTGKLEIKAWALVYADE